MHRILQRRDFISRVARYGNVVRYDKVVHYDKVVRYDGVASYSNSMRLNFILQ